MKQAERSGAGWAGVCLLARRIAAGLVAIAAFASSSLQADEDLWSRLKSGGHVVVVRHASTEPGVGDPPNLKLGDCATQRNLSAPGREESTRLGGAFRARGIPVDEVLSSEWCRCRDTAQLAFGRYAPWPPLNSFFSDRSAEGAQTRAVRERAARWQGPGNLVLVTHQVNITALTGVFPAQGEMVVLRPGGGDTVEVVGRLAPPAGRSEK
jgi:phosphohistidine phosphatase SixA